MKKKKLQKDGIKLIFILKPRQNSNKENMGNNPWESQKNLK